MYFRYPLRKLKELHKIYIYKIKVTLGVRSEKREKRAMRRGVKLIPVHGALLDNASSLK